MAYNYHCPRFAAGYLAAVAIGRGMVFMDIAMPSNRHRRTNARGVSVASLT
jgi:hypothetical protein